MPPWFAEIIPISMGIESHAFVLLAKNAILFALFNASPSSSPAMIFFWLGQMINQTLPAMIMPSNIPVSYTHLTLPTKA